MDPVLTLYCRRFVSRLAYWLLELGYDLRDRSASNQLYLVYFCLFWLVWVVAVFALLGQSVAEQLARLPLEPALFAVSLWMGGLEVWAMLLLWNAARRSPFVFTEEDAYLICQTPLSRRRVGLVLFLLHWCETCLPFAAGAVILSFVLVEVQCGYTDPGLLIVAYILNSLRALTIVLPLHGALLAAIWGVGALRLRRRELPWLRPAVIALVALLAMGWLLRTSWPGLFLLLHAPLHFTLQAAFIAGNTSWAGGLAFSFLLWVLALIFLATVTPHINLSQAAQETSRLATIQMARGFFYSNLAEAIELRQRLESTYAPSQLLRSQGVSALLEKGVLQSWRAFAPAQLMSWLWLFMLYLGMFLPSNWLVRLVIAGVWTIKLGSLSTHRLRSDLARWWILRSLPVSPARLVLTELAWPLILATLLGWGALLLASAPFHEAALAAAAQLPFWAASAVLAAAYDILRRSQARVLMSPSIAEENVPQPDIWGAIQSLVSVLVPFSLLAWSSTHAVLSSWGWAAVLLTVGIAWLNFRGAATAYKWVR